MNKQISLKFVIAIKIAPASRIFLTTSESCGANLFRRQTNPLLFGLSLIQMFSLHENGTPSNGEFSTEYVSGNSFFDSSKLSINFALYINNKNLRKNIFY